MNAHAFKSLQNTIMEVWCPFLYFLLQLRFALAEAQKNAALLSEYHDLYELQRQRLQRQVFVLTEEKDIWSTAAYSLALKVWIWICDYYFSVVWYYGSIFIYQRYPANNCSFRWSMFWPHQEEVQHIWRYNLYSKGKYFSEFSSRECWLSVL